MIEIGSTIPDVTLMTMNDGDPAPVQTSELFAGKKAILFGVPGAFTPTCSARHLPGFRDVAKEIKAEGIDLIACISVNDVFVVDAWRKSQGVEGEVVMLADGNGDFTRAVELGMDGSAYGMGLRSQRYSMLIESGIVKQLFVEEGGEFSVSSAEHMLETLRS